MRLRLLGAVAWFATTAARAEEPVREVVNVDAWQVTSERNGMLASLEAREEGGTLVARCSEQAVTFDLGGPIDVAADGTGTLGIRFTTDTAPRSLAVRVIAGAPNVAVVEDRLFVKTLARREVESLEVQASVAGAIVASTFDLSGAQEAFARCSFDMPHGPPDDVPLEYAGFLPYEANVKTRIVPEYPAAAMELDLGRVECRTYIYVDPAGVPLHVAFDECPKVFRASATEALMQWRWYPNKADGKAIPGRVTMALVYVLN